MGRWAAEHGRRGLGSGLAAGHRAGVGVGGGCGSVARVGSGLRTGIRGWVRGGDRCQIRVGVVSQEGRIGPSGPARCVALNKEER